MSNLICWWCVHALPEGVCIHLPMKYDEKKKTYNSIGNFCSWACAKAYAIDMGTTRSGEICSFLALMRMQSLGKYLPLKPAPKRQSLACFGGTMSIEEFRSYNGDIEPPRIHYPFEHLYVPVTETINTRASLGPVNKLNVSGRLKAIEDSPAENETFRLKRSKPLSRATSTLESALGIKRKENAS